jgi:hypothetical protein
MLKHFTSLYSSYMLFSAGLNQEEAQGSVRRHLKTAKPTGGGTTELKYFDPVYSSKHTRKHINEAL